jgi:molybdate transport system regulatory protein
MTEDAQATDDLERGTAPLSIRLRLGGTARIGPGKVALLEAIAAGAELSEAARLMGMSARRAWLLIDSLNQVFDQALVAHESGSENPVARETENDRLSENDRLRLTPLGEELIKAYRAVEKVTADEVTRQFADIEARLLKSAC